MNEESVYKVGSRVHLNGDADDYTRALLCCMARFGARLDRSTINIEIELRVRHVKFRLQSYNSPGARLAFPIPSAPKERFRGESTGILSKLTTGVNPPPFSPVSIGRSPSDLNKQGGERSTLFHHRFHQASFLYGIRCLCLESCPSRLRVLPRNAPTNGFESGEST